MSATAGWASNTRRIPAIEDSQIIIHVRMLDHENDLQQETLGIVGVNLLYAAFFLHHKPELMLESLLDNLTTERIEIDMIEFSGIEFRHVDNRVMSLKLVQLGLSGAAMFGPSGEVLQPSEVLRKRPILVERGSFRPVTKVNIDMINSARERFAAELEAEGGQIVELMEITMRNLLAAGKIDLTDFLARADVLAAVGQDRADLGLFRILPPGGLPDPLYLAAHCGDHGRRQSAGSVQGAILRRPRRRHSGSFRQTIHKGFADLRLSAARSGHRPAQHRENVEMPGNVHGLYPHLVERGRIKQLDNFDESVLHIFSRDVLQRIKEDDASWETMVPPEIAEVIKKRQYFGYREAEMSDAPLPR